MSQIRFTVEEAKFVAKLREAIAANARSGEAFGRTHSRAWQFLSVRAAKNLEEHRRRQPDPRNTPGLADIIRNPEASEWDEHSLRFLDAARVAGLSERAAAYFRVIEGRPGDDVGSRYWVTRSQSDPIYLRFYGLTKLADTRARGAGQAGYGQKKGFGRKTIIRNPVPAYHYAFDAAEAFVKARLYYRYAYEELRRVGVPVSTGRR